MLIIVLGALAVCFLFAFLISRAQRSAKPKIKTGSPILDEHFECLDYIRLNYKYRNDMMRLPAIIKACERQIALAPDAAKEFFKDEMESLPGHAGYDRLIRIRKSQGEYVEARRLAEEALKQGWKGNWGKLIADCDRAIEKVNRGGQ